MIWCVSSIKQEAREFFFFFFFFFSRSLPF